MKRISIVTFCLLLAGVAFAQNPFITHMYTADPSTRVFNDTLYVYPSHDEDTATWFHMQDWHVFSTTNMKDWTDHGVVFSLDDIGWGHKGSPHPFRRSICVDKLYYNADGTIQEVIPTK